MCAYICMSIFWLHHTPGNQMFCQNGTSQRHSCQTVWEGNQNAKLFNTMLGRVRYKKTQCSISYTLCNQRGRGKCVHPENFREKIWNSDHTSWGAQLWRPIEWCPWLEQLFLCQRSCGHITNLCELEAEQILLFHWIFSSSPSSQGKACLLDVSSLLVLWVIFPAPPTARRNFPISLPILR